MKKNKLRILILLLVISLLGGCTKYMKDGKNPVVNPKTGQRLVENILCQPSDKESIKIYKNKKVDIDKLKKCSEFTPFNSEYEGLGNQLFVKPLSWLIIKIGSIFKSYGLGLIIVTILIRLMLLPITIKSQKQGKKLQEMQPEIQKIDKKYEGKNDTKSMQDKGLELTMLYQKNKINPFAAIMTPIFQIIILFAFFEAIQRVPAIFEDTFLIFDMAKTPAQALKHGNSLYLLLTALNIVITYYSFKSLPNPDPNASGNKMARMMVLFIGFTSLFMPTALNLYWITSSLVAILQTAILNKEDKTLKVKGGKK